MILEIEVTRALELLLVALTGVMPIVVTLWVKLVLYRRRVEADNKEASKRNARPSKVRDLRSVCANGYRTAAPLSSSDPTALRELRKKARTIESSAVNAIGQ